MKASKWMKELAGPSGSLGEGLGEGQERGEVEPVFCPS